MTLPALLLQAAAPSGDDAPQTVLVGYIIVAVGALDIVTAILMLMAGKPTDEGARKRLAAVLSMAGVGMIGVGALFWMGILGR